MVTEIVKTIFPKQTVGVDSILGILPFYHIYGIIILDSFSLTAHLAHIMQVPLNFCIYRPSVESQWLFNRDLTPFNFVPTLKGTESPPP